MVFDNVVVWCCFFDDKYFQSQKEFFEYFGFDELMVVVVLLIGKLLEVIMQEMVVCFDCFGLNMVYQVGCYYNVCGIEVMLWLINKIVLDDFSMCQVLDIVKGCVVVQEMLKFVGCQCYVQCFEIKFGGKLVGDLKLYGEDCIELCLCGFLKDKCDVIFEQFEWMLLLE